MRRLKHPNFTVIIEGDGGRRYVTRLFDGQTGGPTVYVWGPSHGHGLIVTGSLDENGQPCLMVERQRRGEPNEKLASIALGEGAA